MLYFVRLQYGIHLEANSESEAFGKACRALREHPGSHIASVRQAAAPKRRMPLWKRILTGQ
jgi:hypothetical protein